jgi:hypothetical protein
MSHQQALPSQQQKTAPAPTAPAAPLPISAALLQFISGGNSTSSPRTGW